MYVFVCIGRTYAFVCFWPLVTQMYVFDLGLHIYRYLYVLAAHTVCIWPLAAHMYVFGLWSPMGTGDHARAPHVYIKPSSVHMDSLHYGGLCLRPSLCLFLVL